MSQPVTSNRLYAHNKNPKIRSSSKAETVPPSAGGVTHHLEQNHQLMRSVEPNNNTMMGGAVYTTSTGSSKLHLTPQVNKS